MADGSADFTLRLRDQITGPSRKMSASIRGLSSDLKSQQRFFAKGETDFQKVLKEKRRVMDRAHGQEMRAMRAKRLAAQRLASTNARLGLRTQARRDREDSAGRPAAIGAIAAIGGGIAAATVAVGFLAAKFTEATLAAVDFGQRSKTALTSILKDGTLAAQQFREVRMEAAGLGLDVTSTVDEFKMLANSGFSVPMSRDLVRMSADLQALTGSSESASLALRAISQIKMKGRLQAEEITGQLAEHGVSADEVYKVLGKTLGKTREEILKMQKAGDLSADVAIPAILQAVRNQLGVEKSGGFAMKINTASVGGMWRTLKGQVQNAFISLGEQVGPGITKAFSSIMASIQAAVAGPQVQALGNAIVSIFDAVSSLVGQTDFATLIKEAASTLGTELTNAATFIRDHATEIRESFMTFVRFMGTTMQMAIDFMRPFVTFMNSDFAKFMMTPLDQTLGAGAVDKVMNPDGSLKTPAQRRAESSASQAGAASAGGNRLDVKFGDVIISADAKTTSEQAGELRAHLDKELRAMLEDL